MDIGPIGSFQILGTLGTGAHSTILHIRRSSDSKQYALKVVPIEDKDEQKYLEQARHEFRVSTAESAAKARRLLEVSAIDLVVLDIMMPGEDGLSLCRQLRATTEVPVIMLTAMAEDTDRVIGLEMGADDYVGQAVQSARALYQRLRLPHLPTLWRWFRRTSVTFIRSDAGHRNDRATRVQR